MCKKPFGYSCGCSSLGTKYGNMTQILRINGCNWDYETGTAEARVLFLRNEKAKHRDQPSGRCHVAPESAEISLQWFNVS